MSVGVAHENMYPVKLGVFATALTGFIGSFVKGKKKNNESQTMSNTRTNRADWLKRP